MQISSLHFRNCQSPTAVSSLCLSHLCEYTLPLVVVSNLRSLLFPFLSLWSISQSISLWSIYFVIYLPNDPAKVVKILDLRKSYDLHNHRHIHILTESTAIRIKPQFGQPFSRLHTPLCIMHSSLYSHIQVII